MNWPGENLLIRLWESLAEKGIGSLLKPWQIRREGRANVDLRRYEMLALADAEREAEEIRLGKRRIRDAEFALSLTADQHEETPSDKNENSDLIVMANTAMVVDTLRKEINVAKAIVHAENEIQNDPAPTPEQDLDDDWLYRWRDYAGAVSSEELQALWGKILAGELKAPGLHSYRLLDFIRNLTAGEAHLVEQIAPFALRDIVVRGLDGVLQDSGVDFDTLLKLQELGILSGLEAFGMTKSFNSTSSEMYKRVLLCHGRGLMIEADDPNKKLSLNVYLITSLGRQVINLGKFAPNEDYIEAVGWKIQESGFKVSLFDYSDIGNGEIRYTNATELRKSE